MKCRVPASPALALGLVFDFDGRGLCADVFLLFDRLFDDSGYCRAGTSRHGDGGLFFCDVCFGRFLRTLCDRNFERFFHQADSASGGRFRFVANCVRTVSRRWSAFGDVCDSDFERAADVSFIRGFAHSYERY